MACSSSVVSVLLYCWWQHGWSTCGMMQCYVKSTPDSFMCQNPGRTTRYISRTTTKLIVLTSYECYFWKPSGCITWLFYSFICSLNSCERQRPHSSWESMLVDVHCCHCSQVRLVTDVNSGRGLISSVSSCIYKNSCSLSELRFETDIPCLQPVLRLHLIFGRLVV